MPATSGASVYQPRPVQTIDISADDDDTAVEPVAKVAKRDPPPYEAMTRCVYDFRSEREVLGVPSMAVVLSEPEPGEECALTLEDISQDELPFLPGVTFNKHHPKLRKLTLPCGHGFGAMNLVYHFTRDKMVCPICRYGVVHPLATECLPDHFVFEMMERLRTDNDRDLADLLSESHAVARSMARSSDVGLLLGMQEILDLHRHLVMETHPRQPPAPSAAPAGWAPLHVLPILDMYQVELNVYGFVTGADDDDLPTLQFRFDIHCEEGGSVRDIFTFVMREPDIRCLTNAVRSTPLTRIALAVQGRAAGGRVVQLAMSPPFDITRSGGGLGGDSIVTEGVVGCAPPESVGADYGWFDIYRALSDTATHQIRWRTPHVNMLRLIDY